MSILFSHPIKKLTLLGTFAGGYVLGAKAGRERYEQIRDAANQFAGNPRVQEATARAEDLARETATKVTEDPRVKEAAARAQDVVRDATATVSNAAGGSKGATTDSAPAGTKEGDSAQDGPLFPPVTENPSQPEDEVVYSTGPDVEETVEELLPSSDDDRI
jgi:hypothetical protein